MEFSRRLTSRHVCRPRCAPQAMGHIQPTWALKVQLHRLSAATRTTATRELYLVQTSSSSRFRKFKILGRRVSFCKNTSINHVVFAFPAPNAQANNGLECFSCATSQCNTPIQCMGVEDRCFQLNGELNSLKYELTKKPVLKKHFLCTVTSGSTPTSFFGCASANLCLSASTLAALPLLQSAGNITSDPTCCDTSLCNGVTRATGPPTEANTPTPAPAITSSDTSCFRPGMILVTLGLIFFTVC